LRVRLKIFLVGWVILWVSPSWVRIPSPAPKNKSSVLVEFAFHLKREGYKESTILYNVKALKALAKSSDLDDPESVKDAIAIRDVSDNRKEVLVVFYKRYAKWKRLDFHPPRYRRIDKLPFVPLESEIEQLISVFGKKMASYLMLLKDTGVRAGEAWNIKWINLDPNSQTVTIEPEKGSRARQLKITSRTYAMIMSLPRKNDYLFGDTSFKDFSQYFFIKRKQAVEQFNNPRLQKINFKSLRHFKATMEYHKTKDILHVMHILGHKNIRNTLVYTHLVNWSDEAYVCKVAKTVDEARELIESGFEHVTDFDNVILFRKRK